MGATTGRAGDGGVCAAVPQWLAVGRLPYWVEPFARRAEAILITATAISLPLQSLEADPDEAPYTYIFDGPVSNDLLRAYSVHMRTFLLREFPGRTFVASGERLKRLRAVRARR